MGVGPRRPPTPDDVSRAPFIPAFAAHPNYLPLARPLATPMGHPMFPEYRAQSSGVPMLGGPPPHPYVREMTGSFYQSQATRVANNRQMPHFA